MRMIAKKAISKNTGARGLRAILESTLTEAMYEVCFFVNTYWLYYEFYLGERKIKSHSIEPYSLHNHIIAMSDS